MDLIGKHSCYKDHHLALSDQIAGQLKQYALSAEDLNEMPHRLDSDNEEFDSIAPAIQDVERQDEDEVNKDLHSDFNEGYDLSADLGIPSREPSGEPLILNEMQDDQYRTMVQNLNKEQKEFFSHTLHLIKTSDKPFYAFLSAGGGVGKSHLTKSIYQAALKFYNSREGDGFHQASILLLAATGKAAFLIKGNTIHNALAVPASQSLKN